MVNSGVLGKRVEQEGGHVGSQGLQFRYAMNDTT
jgi:hypothetical protein